jgi:hypothetical protein
MCSQEIFQARHSGIYETKNIVLAFGNNTLIIL